jgi:predicted DNA-binding transcriptional regulator YafY
VNDTAAQLRRILHLIPRCEDDTPYSLDEVARELGTDRKTLLGDLRAISERWDDPGGFVEGVHVFIEPGRFVLRSDHFRRPMRLILAEVGALELGLAVLEAERPPDERETIGRARERLRRVMVDLPADEPAALLRHAEQGADADPAILRVVREGVSQGRLVAIRYLSARAVEPTGRTVAPLALVPSRGRWFLVAMQGEECRVFRVDRMESAVLTEERFERPDGNVVEALVNRERMFLGEPGEKLVVRYSARIAPWISEREGKEPDPDGSVTIEYGLGDDEWAVEHVLSYGPEALVVSPARVRELVRERLRAMVGAVQRRGP